MDYNTLIITKRGENWLDWKKRNDGKPIVNFSVHKFAVSSEKEVRAILNHPSIKGWEYGISIGHANY